MAEETEGRNAAGKIDSCRSSKSFRRIRPYLEAAALVALVGSLALLTYAWFGFRSYKNSVETVSGLEMLANRVSHLGTGIEEQGISFSNEALQEISDLRNDLDALLIRSESSLDLKEDLVRADTALTLAERELEEAFAAGRFDSSDFEGVSGRLDEALDLLVRAAEGLRPGISQERRMIELSFAFGLTLAWMALGITVLTFVTSLGSGRPGRRCPDPGAFPLLLETAVRSTEEGVLITDTGMQIGEPMILFANDSFKRMAGFPGHDLVGRPLRMLRTTCLREKEFSLLEHRYSNSKSATMETIRRNRDGSEVFCQWHISPVRGPDGKVTHFISILMDITRLREQEAAQRRSKEELIKANRQLKENQQQLIHSEKMAFLGQLAAGVAHEINNPVGYVMSNLETLMDDITDLMGAEDTGARTPPETKRTPADFFAEAFEILEESIAGLDRVKDIVQGLKNFARPADGEIRTADINHEIEVALKIVGNELGRRCTVRKNLGDLPLIDCRPGQLNQVFANLLANAAQAIVGNGTITVTTEFTGSEILVEVSDDGIGIEEENLSQLFTPFFTTKPTGKGTGLGLSISYGIVRKHNGTIDVESTVGQGSTFTVRLPVPPGDRQATASPTVIEV